MNNIEKKLVADIEDFMSKYGIKEIDFGSHKSKK